LSQNQFLEIGCCFYDLKKGVFAVFWFGKTDSTFRAFLTELFPSSPKTIFFRIPHKISALTDKRFSTCGRYKQPKKGYFWPFLGCKTENQIPDHF
jgi:hypothetical protein